MCISIAGHYLGLPWYITLPMCLHERNPQTAVQWSVSHICVTLDNAPTDEHSTDDVCKCTACSHAIMYTFLFLPVLVLLLWVCLLSLAWVQGSSGLQEDLTAKKNRENKRHL